MSSGGADDYIEEPEPDGDFYWEDGYYDQGDWDSGGGYGGGGGGEYGGFGGGGGGGGGDFGGDSGQWSGSDWGEGVSPSSYPEADWRAELQTAEGKRDYLERVLGVRPGDESYKSDYRYIGLIASGQRNPTGERWSQVMHTAQINASAKERYREPDPPVRGEPRSSRSFQNGDWLQGSARWNMGGRERHWEGTVTLDSRTAQIANSGDIVRAFIAAYLDGGGSR